MILQGVCFQFLVFTCKAFKSIHHSRIFNGRHLSMISSEGIGKNVLRKSGGKLATRGSDINQEPSLFVEKLEKHFHEKMQTSKVKLFENFTMYADSLPVRDDGYDEYLRLYQLQFIVRPEDLTTMAKRIIAKPDLIRRGVRYLAAPGGSGKTASVLPAFLESTSMANGGTHYLYIAFDNNNQRDFYAKPFEPNADIDVAELQGAAFMVQCVKNLLERPEDMDAYEVVLIEPESLKKNVEDYVEDLHKYLQDRLGDESRVWFHVDEHYKMCDRVRDPERGAAFSRGAMGVLAFVPRAIVVATYVDRPVEIPTAGSSGVYRVPIALPPLDVDQVMSGLVPQLYVNSTAIKQDNRAEELRLLATLKLRMGLSLYGAKGINVFHRPGKNPVVKEFLSAFESAMKGGDRVQALKDCINLCRIDINTPIKEDSDATKLLLGIKDDEDFGNSRRLPGVVLLFDGTLSLNWLGLLDLITSPVSEVFESGSSNFVSCISDASDLLSSTPLEAAYHWTLSSASAYYGYIEFGLSSSYTIKCKSLEAARLFPGTDSSVYDLHFLKQNVMYYAEERNGLPTHPLANMFFITKRDELVLVDITGGTTKLAVEKACMLRDWIAQEQSKIPQYKLQGVVLAPNAIETSVGVVTNVKMVCGSDAITLLGGLNQLRRWLD